MLDHADVVVIGAGFYGLRIALFLRERLQFRRVVVLESSAELMNRASYVNQARVHNGYHYPRSILTGYRSQINFPSFAMEYREAIDEDFVHYYGIARTLSKTSARQFERFCHRIGSSITEAPSSIAKNFDGGRIEKVFLVKEPSFDSRVLRRILLDRIEAAGGIELRTRSAADRIVSAGRDVEVQSGDRSVRAPRVISAVYSGLNTLHESSGLPLIDLQHELTELVLITMPTSLEHAAVTIMDGPFFSIMPFPSRRLHSLSHVRYTPHHRWREGAGSAPRNPYAAVDQLVGRSNFSQMRADVVRYLPEAGTMSYRDSLFEAKTVLARSAQDDSRPILFRSNHGIRGYTCIMGGKLDNIYDVLSELEGLYGAR